MEKILNLFKVIHSCEQPGFSKECSLENPGLLQASLKRRSNNCFNILRGAFPLLISEHF